MPDEVAVTFTNGGAQVLVARGTTVLEAAYRAGIHIPATCGGRGTCGTCAVRLVEGAPGPVLPAARTVRLPKGLYLACLLTVEAPVTVTALNVIQPG